MGSSLLAALDVPIPPSPVTVHLDYGPLRLSLWTPPALANTSLGWFCLWSLGVVRFCLQRACVSGSCGICVGLTSSVRVPPWCCRLPPFRLGRALVFIPSSVAGRSGCVRVSPLVHNGAANGVGGVYVFKFVFLFSVVEYRAQNCRTVVG